MVIKIISCIITQKGITGSNLISFYVQTEVLMFFVKKPKLINSCCVEGDWWFDSNWDMSG